MKTIVAALLMFVVWTAAPAVAAEHTRVTYPNAVSLELFGRGLLYGVSFDRVINDDLVVGLSYGSSSLDTLGGIDAGTSVQLLPAYVNYYFARGGDSLFATAGASLVLNPDDADGNKAQYSGVKFSSTPVLPTFGAGFESRGDTGFLFRLAAYGIVGKSVAPWFGFTLGYAF